MYAFLGAQMDYILFLNGLSFATLAAVCFFMFFSTKNKQLTWLWLAIFALITAGTEWSKLAAKTFGDSSLFFNTRAFLTGAAVLFLAWAVFLISKRYEKYKVFLITTAILITLYALVGWRLKLDISDFILIYAKLIQIFLALLASIAIIIWNLKNSTSLEADFRIKIRSMYVYRAAIALSILVVFGWFATDLTEKYVENQAREKLLFRILTIQSSIQPEYVTNLTGTDVDKGKANYQALQRQLHQIQQVNDDCKYTYVLGIRNNNVIVYLNSELNNSPSYVPPGSVCAEGTALFLQDMLKGKPFIVGPYADQFGNWVSGVAPITNANTNEIIAFVGMDIDANSFWIKEVAVYRFAVIIIMLIFSILLLYLFISLERNKESAIEIAELQIESVRLENENKLAAERKKASEALRKSEERYRDLFENANDLIQCVKPDGSFVYVNSSWLNTLGYTEEELAKLNLMDILCSENITHCTALFDKVMNGEVMNVETTFVTKDGRYIDVEGNVSCRYKNGKPSATRGIFRDVTERKQAERKIKYLAYNDTLTGLPNRLLFKERLNEALADAQSNNKSFAVLFLDLDRFKTINDTLGHDVGDAILGVAAKRIKACAREEKDTVARLGGDEFTLLINDIASIEEAEYIAQRILEAFKNPIHLDGNEYYITPSIGVTIYPDDAQDAHTMLKNADTAMYHAKEQ